MSDAASIKQRFGLVGRSLLFDRALNTAARVAGTELTVLITGESGVGKEVFSHIIHALSPRKHNKFIAVNCGAIPQGTINSELFGHEKGAFTGATADRKGYFESVDGGTIFLDEVGEMPMDTQTYLLRVLESGEFMKVGSSHVQKTDVRVIAASNVDLKERIRQGRFRDDLYYRLNTVPIHIPSLKERPEDINILIRRFAVDFAETYHTESIRFDDQAKNILIKYSWPGNIRELKNLIEQLSVLSEDKQIDAETLLQIAPHLAKTNLPALTRGSGDGFQEREILYKLLFDMKGDLHDLKQLVFELIRGNNLRVPESMNFRPIQPSSSSTELVSPEPWSTTSKDIYPINTNQERTPLIIDDKKYTNGELVDESLALEDMEKDMIKKSLKRHGGRRKEAALELGISERTLYRKIKQYDI
ncbi:MAG: sigma-54-dependent Fis family transcriptional regulator [Saprospiraceae bacterium]|uniref:Sigma-54-dependent Fis family transcriptional regulator n=1 Tax=Candidatus Opimibacter skivensis TaxID=2982028 RepID=A0A9D7SSX1_9BACT|nr:sigma-54-dependent Fis family transcriptional regulator [Candidatus Opimibacter skivensis]